MPIISLRQMRTGETGRIVKIDGTGIISRRLRDMGMVPGTEIQVQGRAPLYDPVNIKIRGNNLTMRNREADFITVQVERPDEGEAK